MIEIVEFKPEHFAEIRLQPGQEYLRNFLSFENGSALARNPSYTGLEDGVPVACAGYIVNWPGRATAWSFLSEMGPRSFVQVHKAIKKVLDGCYIKRMEMTVLCDHEEGHRWAKLLGFELEAERMEAYDPEGNDHALYARVL